MLCSHELYDRPAKNSGLSTSEERKILGLNALHLFFKYEDM